MKKAIKAVWLILASAALFLSISAGYYALTLPDSFYVEKGSSLTLSTKLSITASSEETVESFADRTSASHGSMALKLFGVVPVKEVEVLTVDTPVLVPGGQPFGIKLLMEGVMVVGMGDAGSGICPAEECGIEPGDIILSINGEKMTSNSDIQDAVSECGGKTVEIIYRRDEKEYISRMQPVYSERDGSYKAGMWVRDSTAGIGTVTFYEPSTGRFGGLGHPICDSDTGEIVPISKGEVVDVRINGVQRSTEGTPGELLGSFISRYSSGSIYCNNKYGIYGKLYSVSDHSEGIPMAMKQEITEGSAVIYTTIDGTEPKEYSINIDKIDYKNSDTKNMTITVTDKELLKKTGGIVQGMSGSPIIQNGKLVGAVTHVFVNDPEKGYGIFCENMYSSAIMY